MYSLQRAYRNSATTACAGTASCRAACAFNINHTDVRTDRWLSISPRAGSELPFGLNIDGARHDGSLGLVADLGWAHGSDDTAGVDSSFNAWNYGVGGRWTGFNSGRVWPFAQVIIGAETLHTSVDVGGIDTSDTQTSFMLQPGVGVNFIVAEGVGLVGQVDYRRTFFDEPEGVDNSINNQFRVFVGLRMILD